MPSAVPAAPLHVPKGVITVAATPPPTAISSRTSWNLAATSPGTGPSLRAPKSSVGKAAGRATGVGSKDAEGEATPVADGLTEAGGTDASTPVQPVTTLTTIDATATRAATRRPTRFDGLMRFLRVSAREVDPRRLAGIPAGRPAIARAWWGAPTGRRYGPSSTVPTTGSVQSPVSRCV